MLTSDFVVSPAGLGLKIIAEWPNLLIHEVILVSKLLTKYNDDI